MEMGLKHAQAGRLIILLTAAASMLAVGMANNKNHTGATQGWNNTECNVKPPKNTGYSPKTYIVGGSAKWTFGFNYTDWAVQNAPFYVHDILVFKYDPPVDNSIHPHNVYLLRNYRSFLNCNLSRAKLIADETQGGGEGFKFRLIKKRKPYYFACAIKKGIHCSVGMMKFSVMPLCRCG